MHVSHLYFKKIVFSPNSNFKLLTILTINMEMLNIGSQLSECMTLLSTLHGHALSSDETLLEILEETDVVSILEIVHLYLSSLPTCTTLDCLNPVYEKAIVQCLELNSQLLKMGNMLSKEMDKFKKKWFRTWRNDEKWMALVQKMYRLLMRYRSRLMTFLMVVKLPSCENLLKNEIDSKVDIASINYEDKPIVSTYTVQQQKLREKKRKIKASIA